MKLRNVYPSTYVVEAPSGRTYRAEGGQEITVDTDEDAKLLLSITRKMGCCGTPERTVQVFEITATETG